MDQNKPSGRLYAAIFYPCMLAAVMLVGVMLFSPDGGITTSAAAASGDDVSHTVRQTTAVSTVPAVTSSTAPAVTELSLRWSSTQLHEFMQHALETADIGLHVQSVQLQDPDRVEVRATAQRDEICRVIEESSWDNKNLVLFALRLLPQEVDTDAVFSISCTSGMLSLSPLEWTIAGLQLPVSLIPEHVQDEFTRLADDTLTQQGCSLDRLFIADNTLYLDCTLQLNALK